MRFLWDEAKNRAKHKVSFETARLVFEDPFALSILDRIVDGEERWQTLGLAGGAVVLLVAHTYREEGGEEVIRITHYMYFEQASDRPEGFAPISRHIFPRAGREHLHAAPEAVAEEAVLDGSPAERRD